MLTPYKTHQHQGFTLIELSVVLVIIGLILGAVTASVSLIRDAALKRLIQDAEFFHGTVTLFKGQYQELPGDFSHAGRIWGNDCNGSSAGSDECSGNGNRLIEHATDDSLGDNTTSETLLLWQHLNKAELLDRSYTGLPTAGCGASDNFCVTAGVNAPEGSISNSAIYVISESTTRSLALMFGGQRSGSWNDNPILTPLEAYEIDNKVDDGVNNTGTFHGAGTTDNAGDWSLTFNGAFTAEPDGTNVDCYDDTTSTAYTTSYDANACGAVFIIGKN